MIHRRIILYVIAIAFAQAIRCASGDLDPGPAFLLPGLVSEPPGTTRTYFTYPQPHDSDIERFRARNTVVDRIDGARRSIVAFVYGFNEPHMIAALRRAQDRGVELSITGSPDQNYDEAEAAGLSIARRTKSGLQHVKLLLIDGRILISGTGNFTRSGFFQNNNVFIERFVDTRTATLVHRSLAFEDETTLPAFIDIGPGPLSAKNDRVLVAPRHGRLIQRELVRAILSARHSIRFLIFSYTDPMISAALYVQARRGVRIEGIFDDEYNRGELPEDHAGARLNAGLGFAPAVFYLEGNRAVTAEAVNDDDGADGEPGPFAYHGGHLHHKTLIVDGERVWTGSYNWSLSARDRNLEIVFDLHEPAIVRSFEAEFERIRERAVVLPRPPLDADLRDRILVGPDAPLQLTGLDYCVHANITSMELSVFTGRGPYFRGYHLPGGATCRDAGKPGRASFGPLSGNGYALELSARDAVFTGGPVHRGGADALRPCESGCGVLDLHRAHPADGWFWLTAEAPANLRSVYVWNRGGFSAELPLTRIAGDFYRYEPPAGGGDSLLFVRDAAGEVRLGCVISGAGLDRGLGDFLDAFELETGRRPACISAD